MICTTTDKSIQGLINKKILIQKNQEELRSKLNCIDSFSDSQSTFAVCYSQKAYLAKLNKSMKNSTRAQRKEKRINEMKDRKAVSFLDYFKNT